LEGKETPTFKEKKRKERVASLARSERGRETLPFSKRKRKEKAPLLLAGRKRGGLTRFFQGPLVCQPGKKKGKQADFRLLDEREKSRRLAASVGLTASYDYAGWGGAFFRAVVGRGRVLCCAHTTIDSAAVTGKDRSLVVNHRGAHRGGRGGRAENPLVYHSVPGRTKRKDMNGSVAGKKKGGGG